MPESRELYEELQSVFSGNNTLLDSILPSILFLIDNALFGFQVAMITSLGISVLITILRLLRGQKIWYALGGTGAALLAIGFRFLLDSAEAFFLPIVINGELTILVLLINMLIRHPALAFTSHLTRRWPLKWYWHPHMRPAYNEVAAFWVIFFGLKLAGQLYFYLRLNKNGLALFNVLSGWPALIVLLVISYLYRLKQLRQLKGPSVEEFTHETPPPWIGQQRGF